MAHPHPPLRLHLHRFTTIALVVLLSVLAFAGGISGYGALRWRRRSPGDIVDVDDISVPSSPSSSSSNCAEENSTRWAIIIAGSSGYGNYRHQADVCHAYQVLRKGGLKEENIVVFMYDDIAGNPLNPRPGTIINNPNGENVYEGVPKDYTGANVTVNNFLAAFLGNKSALTGGSGKVIESGPEDHIFVFYSDHGGPGVLGMPTEPNLYANELVEAFKKKHEANGYKEMVVYLEACESGSIFEGLLPNNLSIYATTASNAEESSWGTYCPGMVPPPPPEYITCLGDLYSVSWMEDSESQNLKLWSLQEQYDAVKMRTSNYNTYTSGSHVMCYGSAELAKEKLCRYLGSDPLKENVTTGEVELEMPSSGLLRHRFNHQRIGMVAMMQRDADILYLWHKFKAAHEGSSAKMDAQDELFMALAHRRHIDRSVWSIGKLLLLKDGGDFSLEHKRPSGQPLVDDWDCLKDMVRSFEKHCGPLANYGLKYTRAFANMCNFGVSVHEMEVIAPLVCPRRGEHHNSM